MIDLENNLEAEQFLKNLAQSKEYYKLKDFILKKDQTSIENTINSLSKKVNAFVLDISWNKILEINPKELCGFGRFAMRLGLFPSEDKREKGRNFLEYVCNQLKTHLPEIYTYWHQNFYKTSQQ